MQNAELAELFLSVRGLAAKRKTTDNVSGLSIPTVLRAA
jgi:hypothetical protein